MTLKLILVNALLIITALLFTSCAASSTGNMTHTAAKETADMEKITPDTAIQNVINNPAFKGFGQFLFPTDFYTPASDMKVSDAGRLLPYHTHVSSTDSCNVLNYLLEQRRRGQRVFYDIYSANARKLNPELQKTGLFFFRGKPGAPFAVICAGGGFAYVGSIHESFPHALELSEKGYNAFALLYRTGSAQKACGDLAAALTFIFSKRRSIKNQH